MFIEIIAVGHLKNDPCFDLWSGYLKRMKWKVSLIELDFKKGDARKVQNEQNQKIMNKLGARAFVVALDERGKVLASREFSKKLNTAQNHGFSKIQFVLGGADGLLDCVRERANLVMSFGALTWPHMLARVMLIEQVYRAQQILSGHPYHRD